MRYSEPYKGAVKLQRLMLRDAENPELKPLIRAGLARAYCELEEMKRKIAMKPLPKSIDVTKLHQHRRKPDDASFSEPAPPKTRPETNDAGQDEMKGKGISFLRGG